MKDRVRRIFEKLPEGTEAIVLVNSAEPHLDQSFFYVFDVPSGLFEGSAAVGFPDGKLHVLSSLLEEESAREAAKHDPDVAVDTMTQPDDRRQWLARLLPSGGPIALNYRELTHEDFLSLEKSLPKGHWVDASTAVRRARAVKDAREIERLRRAGAIASTVGSQIPSLLKGGMTETELASEIEYRMMRAGASGRSFSTIVGFGRNGAEPHYVPQDVRLEPGMSLVCDFGAFFQRYASDLTRSFHFGPTDPELKKVHECVEAAQAAGFAAVRAGVPGKEVHLAAQKVIDASPWKGRFIHGVGHSIGLAVHDGYGMSARTEEPLEAGMAITIEPGIYLPGHGGVRIEDDVLVTATGMELLTTTARGYIEVPA
ncbi:MAG TPA: M24 family metallopeptidase [Thermoplasmata archaeon]|nr:M24 family metallopeptidase [Thermoplasmata archaeon]